MSLVVTIYTREGIVMASDSRLTLNAQKKQHDQEVVQLAVGQTDSVYKLFLTPKNIGISTFGAADVEGVPIAGYIESFIGEHLSGKGYEVDEVPQLLVDYFKHFSGPPDVGFHVAGYKAEAEAFSQHVWGVRVSREEIVRANQSGQQGALWNGETDILTRLIQPVGLLDQAGNLRQVLPHYQIPWRFFTLQDAIDYAVHAIRVTIDSFRFQPRAKTVGGPIDVLVIKPHEAFWLQRKELRV